MTALPPVLTLADEARTLDLPTGEAARELVARPGASHPRVGISTSWTSNTPPTSLSKKWAAAVNAVQGHLSNPQAAAQAQRGIRLSLCRERNSSTQGWDRT